MIVKRGKKWLVVSHDGSKVLGEHETRDAAERQLRAVEANKRNPNAAVRK
jgi:hypothetical protein